MPISLYRYLIGILHLFLFLFFLSINYRLIFRYIEAQLSRMWPKWTYAVYLRIKFVSDRSTISWSNCLCSQNLNKKLHFYSHESKKPQKPNRVWKFENSLKSGKIVCIFFSYDVLLKRCVELTQWFQCFFGLFLSCVFFFFQWVDFLLFLLDVLQRYSLDLFFTYFIWNFIFLRRLFATSIYYKWFRFLRSFVRIHSSNRHRSST